MKAVDSGSFLNLLPLIKCTHVTTQSIIPTRNKATTLRFHHSLFITAIHHQPSSTYTLSIIHLHPQHHFLLLASFWLALPSNSLLNRSKVI